MTAPVNLSGVLESAFLHNTSGGRVIDEEVRPQSKEALDIETVIDHRPERFSGDSMVPVRFGYPVADFGILLPEGCCSRRGCSTPYNLLPLRSRAE